VDRGHDAIHAAVDYEIALMAQHREIAGIVVDGTATNRIRLQELGFPVFCRGYSPAACVAQGISGEIDVPVDCGGVIVNPGDLIIGDADGVVVLPPEECEARLRKAEAEMSRIARRDERIAGEGYRFLSCEDVDMEAFVRADVLSFIDGIKKKCRYD
jgi:regulator of RNase E activity RraA